MSTIELLPCPFCGKVPTLERDKKLAWILCPEGSICRGSGIVQAFKVENMDEGIRVWNTRADGAIRKACIEEAFGIVNNSLNLRTAVEELCKHFKFTYENGKSVQKEGK
jgi:hypothetical protein